MSITAIPLGSSALSRILSPRELGEITGLAPATIWRMRRRGELPDPIRLSPNRVGWREDVIAQWLESKGQRHTTDGAPRRRATDR